MSCSWAFLNRHRVKGEQWKEDKNPIPFQLYIKDGNHNSREHLWLIQLIHHPLFELGPNSHWSQEEYFLCLLCWNGLSLSKSSGKAKSSLLAKGENALSPSSRNAKAIACQTCQRGLAELLLPSHSTLHLERSHSKTGSVYPSQTYSTIYYTLYKMKQFSLVYLHESSEPELSGGSHEQKLRGFFPVLKTKSLYLRQLFAKLFLWINPRSSSFSCTVFLSHVTQNSICFSFGAH